MKFIRSRSLSALVLYVFIMNLLVSCGSNSSSPNENNELPVARAAKITFDTNPPQVEGQTDAPIATIYNYTGNGLPDGYNISYWGSKLASGVATGITQSLIWHQGTEDKGVRTFYDANGNPIFVKNENDGTSLKISWDIPNVTFTFYNADGIETSVKTLTMNGDTVSLVTDGVAPIPQAMSIDDSMSIAGFSRSMIQALARDVTEASATGAIIGVSAALLLGIPTGLVAATFGYPLIVGFSCYIIFSDTVAGIPNTIDNIGTTFAEGFRTVANKVDDLSGVETRYYTEPVTMDTTATTADDTFDAEPFQTTPSLTCTGGQIKDNFSCRCPTGQDLVNGVCETPTVTCNGGQVLVGNSCECPTGQSLVDGVCETPTVTSLEYTAIVPYNAFVNSTCESSFTESGTVTLDFLIDTDGAWALFTKNEVTAWSGTYTADIELNRNGDVLVGDHDYVRDSDGLTHNIHVEATVNTDGTISGSYTERFHGVSYADDGTSCSSTYTGSGTF